MLRFRPTLFTRPRRAAAVCWVAACCLLLLASCTSASTTRLTITGSTSMSPFVELLAEHYQAEHPGVAIDVQGLGSSAGIRAALDGVSELGMSSRLLTAEEADQLAQMVMARDALAIIVHPTNPVTGLTTEQVRALFAGSITSWAELGGPARPVVLVSREAGSGTHSAFEELVMQGTQITSSALRQGSNGAIRQIVADNPDAIGYISLGVVDDTVRPVAIDGVTPTIAEVQSGSYRIMRPFLIVWHRDHELSPPATAFLEYIHSPAGQAELIRSGLVPGEAAP
nr:MAG: phosphate-binding protein [Chloroflexota bacterium]